MPNAADGSGAVSDAPSDLFTVLDYERATFSALAALAYKLTGQAFRLKVTNDRGDYFWVDSRYTSGDNEVRWINLTEEPPYPAETPEASMTASLSLASIAPITTA